MKINKISVIGISASGKSVFARELSKRTGLPLFHMDNLFWKGNWEAVSESKYLEEEKKLIIKNQWIIEGYVDETMSGRLQAADRIIYLDYSGIRCAFRFLKRWFMHRRASRPELPDEALDELDLSFLWRVLFRKERPGIEKALDVVDKSKVIRVYTPRSLQSLQL